MSDKTLTIYCHCSYYDLADEKVKADVLAAIADSGVEFEAVSDLCRLCAQRDPVLKEWAGAESIRIYACHRRAIKWLFHAGGAPLPENGVEFFNMRTGKAEDIIASLPKGSTDGRKREDIALDKDGEWTPWFPVIDYDRCKNCKQCMNFCLFGTYQLDDDGIVEVVKPANCKTNCPACARVCPNAAIIFPKYGESPINGDEVDEAALREQKEKERLDKALGGNVHDAIRGRSKKRFSKDAGGRKSETASFSEMRRKLDIPADVLNSMTPDEIARISKESAARKAKQSENNLEENDINE